MIDAGRGDEDVAQSQGEEPSSPKRMSAAHHPKVVVANTDGKRRPRVVRGVGAMADARPERVRWRWAGCPAPRSRWRRAAGRTRCRRRVSSRRRRAAQLSGSVRLGLVGRGRACGDRRSFRSEFRRTGRVPVMIDGARRHHPTSLWVTGDSPIHSRSVFLSLVCWMKTSCSGGSAGSAVCGLLK